MVVSSMSYATYERYKDSGVDWLGEIPSDWELGRISAFFSERRQKVSDKDYPALSVTKLGVFPQWENVAKSNDGDNRKLVKKGDFVINSRSDRKGSSGIAKQDGSVSLINIVLKPVNIEPRYSEYLFKSYNFIEEFYRVGHGIVADLWTTRFDDIKNSMIALPTFDEQVKIANFLDQKTAQIDQAIALKQQQIEKLGEYKQIVIQNAVTKGLNPNAPMKNSGVEWIGDIPEHWEVKKLKNVSKVVLGKMICNEKTGNMKLKPYLKSKNIQWLKVDLNSVDEMWFTPKEMEMYRLKQGDLVLSEGGEVGKTCIWNNDLEECYIQNSAHKVTFENKQNSKYYLYLFFSLGKQGQFEKIVNRVSIGHLTKEKLINTFVFCPPLSEQNEIVKLIDDYLIKFNEIINCYETQIDRLKEYKNILINQAVTGKIKI